MFFFACLFCGNIVAQHKSGEEVVFVGFIQTSGLMNSQKMNLDLKYSDYLISDGAMQYLLESGLDFSQYRGQFCKIYGRKSTNNFRSIFGCTVINVDRVTKENFRASNIRRHSLMKTRVSFFGDQYHKNKIDTIVGTIHRVKRISPDISIDYEIRLNKSIEYFGSQNTDEAEWVTNVPVMPIDLYMVYLLEEYSGEDKPIKMTGFLHSGPGHILTFSGLKIIN